jgi:large subunit ribosomal protein L24
MKLKKGDSVIVLAGKDKGKKGTITQVLRDENKVVVDGVNVMIKNRKTRQKDTDKQIKFSAPIHASNVMIVDSKTNKPTRIGVKKVDGKNIRISKKSGAELK